MKYRLLQLTRPYFGQTVGKPRAEHVTLSGYYQTCEMSIIHRQKRFPADPYKTPYLLYGEQFEIQVCKSIHLRIAYI